MWPGGDLPVSWDIAQGHSWRLRPSYPTPDVYSEVTYFALNLNVYYMSMTFIYPAIALRVKV